MLYYFKISRKTSEKACIHEYVGISQRGMAVPFSFCFIGGFFSNLFLLGFIPGSGERYLTYYITMQWVKMSYMLELTITNQKR